MAEYLDDETMQVSHETIYKSLFIQARGVLKKQLISHLRSRRIMRRGKTSTTHGQTRGQIVDAVSIRERPAEADDRAIPGHWEGDLLAGGNNTHIATLVERGVAVEILSGDRESAVKHAASALGVLAWRAGLTPADKIAHIEDMKQRGRKVMMVGDGLNDAPALASASVSISPVSATHLSQAAADMIFLGKTLFPVLAAIDYSRKALRLMRENLVLAIGYNALAVPIAIAGYATPLVAAAAMSGSSVLVMLNSLRARRVASGEV